MTPSAILPALPTLTGYRLTEDFCVQTEVSVYRGARESDGAPVLVKLLHEEYPALQSLARLRHEYEITRNLSVAGIAKPCALETYRNGLALILEDKGGQSLDDRLQQTPFDLAVFLEIAIHLAEIVGNLHRQNLVHRAIKPRNIFVHPKTKIVQLTDFGTATWLYARENRSSSTRMTSQSATSQSATSQSANAQSSNAQSSNAQSAEHRIWQPPLATYSTLPAHLQGTLAYMSPEQTGRTAHAVDHRSDLYSMGATFYEMLTAHLPFKTCDELELMHAHIARAPLSPQKVNPEVPPIVAQIVLKLLAQSPSDRYRNAFGLKFDLENCLDSWRRQQKIEPFELGAHDFADHLEFRSKLYGRDAETAVLMAAFSRARDGASEVVLVAGYSGIGKSSLVREIQKPIARENGLFVAGKFDQFRRSVPFASVVEAFRNLMKEVLVADDMDLERWKMRLQNALGDQAQVVIDVIPEVEHLIGAQPRVAELGPQENQQRFSLVFQNFIGVWADAAHPLVLFLDDLQWADAASLKLLRVLAQRQNAENAHENGTPYLLLLGAYRDNEVSASHPALLALDEMKRDGAAIQTIALQALRPQHVAQLMSDVLRCTPERVLPLANLVCEKTGGNPFFVQQMMLVLEREKLLRFHSGEARWNWDLAGIRRADITENVVELMATKIEALTLDTQSALMVAACVGTTFSAHTLSQVLTQSDHETLAQCWEATREGLLLPLEDNCWKFVHDRVQQAAYSLLGMSDQQRIHLQIGHLMLAASQSLPTRHREDTLFETVGHFNRALNYIVEKAEIDTLLALNIAAGRKAKNATAYDAALKYYNTATGLLPRDAWQAHYEDTFALHLELSECEYLVGHIARAQELFTLLTQRATRVLDRIEVYRIRIQLCTIQNDFAQATEIGLQGLKQLGISLCAAPSQAAILTEIIQARRYRRRRSVAQLADAPILTDATQQAALKLLSSLTAPLYISGNQNLFTLVVLKMTTISLRYGNSDVSLQAYALYGVVLGSGLGDYKTGYQFGELALKLCAQFDSVGEQCKAYFTVPCYLSPWRKPLREGESHFREAYRLALQAGNTVFAGYGVVNDTAYRSLSGHALESVREEVDKFVPFLSWTKDPNQMAMALFTRQMCACLEGKTRDLQSLSDDERNENTLLQGLRDNAAARLWYLIVKMKVCYLHGEYVQALAMARRAEANLAPLFGTPYIAEEKFFALLCLAANYRTSSTRIRRDFDRKLKKGHRQLQKWADNCPENYRHKERLIAAEIARVSGHADAMSLYNAAIQDARDNSYGQNEAIAHELAARYCLENGNEKIAFSHLAAARYGFLKWGASQKVALLEQEFPVLDAPTNASGVANSAANSVANSAANAATSTESSQFFARELSAIEDRVLD